jgi:biotin synthase
VTIQRLLPETRHLLASGDDQTRLHEQAMQTASKAFAGRVFLRGVVEVSNFCRENCHYCGMRRDNKTLNRYRASAEQLAEMLIHHRPSSITDINIQTGEDPVAVREIVLPLIRALRQNTNLGVSVCLGTLNPTLYGELQSAGATTYIIKFEIADPVIYEKMEAPGTFAERIQAIRYLAEHDWNVSSGFICGLPNQSPADVLRNILFADQLPLEGCSVSPFIPGDETPLASAAIQPVELTLNAMAAMRLMRPDWVIPAVSALNLAEPNAGYRRGLRTGANLMTMNLTPENVRENYLLYKRDRFIMTEERILAAAAAENLSISRQSLADHYASRKTAPGKSNGAVRFDAKPAVAR